jgi:hypothetical protein
MKILAEDIKVPEVPIPRRIRLARERKVAALKRAKIKSASGKKIALIRKQK